VEYLTYVARMRGSPPPDDMQAALSAALSAALELPPDQLVALLVALAVLRPAALDQQQWGIMLGRLRSAMQQLQPQQIVEAVCAASAMQQRLPSPAPAQGGSEPAGTAGGTSTAQLAEAARLALGSAQLGQLGCRALVLLLQALVQLAGGAPPSAWLGSCLPLLQRKLGAATAHDLVTLLRTLAALGGGGQRGGAAGDSGAAGQEQQGGAGAGPAAGGEAAAAGMAGVPLPGGFQEEVLEVLQEQLLVLAPGQLVELMRALQALGWAVGGGLAEDLRGACGSAAWQVAPEVRQQLEGLLAAVAAGRG
jgi:hypothetical protein